MDEEDLDGVADADDADEGDDAPFEMAKSVLLQRQHEEDEDGGGECGEEYDVRLADAVGEESGTEEEVKAEGGSEELGEVGCDGRDFGSDPGADVEPAGKVG